jgi:uncharacterized membrane protein YfcA
MDYILLFLFGFGAFAISTIAGGGGALILVPLVGFFVREDAVAPLVQMGNFIGRPTRIFLFRKHIRWDISRMYLPAAFVGAFLGAWLFASLSMKGLQLVLGIFLVSTVFQYRFGKKQRSFPMKRWYFAPLGFAVCFLSSLIGATGAVLNPFYLNYGVTKEDLVGTKAINSFLVALVQLPTYAFFGKLYGDMWLMGLSIGLGAAAGNFLGKRWLKRISDKRFLQLVILLMVVSGVVMIVRAIKIYL